MKFQMKRVILFTSNFDEMVRFYGEVLGLELVSSEEGWREFDSGPCRIAIHRGHRGKGEAGATPAKLVFYVEDVGVARTFLMEERKVTMGKIMSPGELEFCDGKDPDGNPFQISSRK